MEEIENRVFRSTVSEFAMDGESYGLMMPQYLPIEIPPGACH